MIRYRTVGILRGDPEEGMVEYKNPDKYENYWTTSISRLERNEVLIRGYPLTELVGQISYVEAVILCVRGELPSSTEAHCVNAIFTSAMDHQFLNATALAARVVVSANPDPVVGMATGILSFGKVTAGVPAYVVEMINHYLPVERNFGAFQEAAQRLVDDYRGRGDRIPGFGHPLHDVDGDHYTFRGKHLRDQAEKGGLPLDGAVAFYEEVHTEFIRQIGKELPINVDGLMGSIFAELEYDPLEVQALAPFTMLPGIAAHVVEEIRDGVPLRIVPESTYTGPAKRSRFATSRED